MQNILKDAALLNLVTNAGTTITINWNTLFDSRLTYGGTYAYELHWDKGLGGDFSKLSDIGDTQFTLATYDRTKTYEFKVRSRNPCGCGPYSEALVVLSRDTA